jgi:hypothetical protein
MQHLDEDHVYKHDIVISRWRGKIRPESMGLMRKGPTEFDPNQFNHHLIGHSLLEMRFEIRGPCPFPTLEASI